MQFVISPVRQSRMYVFERLAVYHGLRPPPKRTLTDKHWVMDEIELNWDQGTHNGVGRTGRTRSGPGQALAQRGSRRLDDCPRSVHESSSIREAPGQAG